MGKFGSRLTKMKKLLALLFIPTYLFAQSSGVGSNWTVITGTLQSAAVANGNGSTLALQGLSTVGLTVNCSVACTGGTTVNFELSQDGTNFTAASGLQLGTSTIAQTVVNQGTTPTVWFINVEAMQLIRARISAYSAGTITVTATAVPGALSSAVVNVGNTPAVSQSGTWNVTVNTALPAGTNLVGKMGLDQTTPGTTNGVQDAATSATGSAVPSKAGYIGGNGSGNLTGNINCDNTAIYDASTNGATQLVALSSGKIVYVCGYSFAQSTATAVHTSLEYGTGTNCATSPIKITPAYSLQAAASTGPTGIVVMAPTGSPGLKGIASNEICILTDAAVSVQAIVWYTQF